MKDPFRNVSVTIALLPSHENPKVTRLMVIHRNGEDEIARITDRGGWYVATGMFQEGETDDASMEIIVARLLDSYFLANRLAEGWDDV